MVGIQEGEDVGLIDGTGEGLQVGKETQTLAPKTGVVKPGAQARQALDPEFGAKNPIGHNTQAETPSVLYEPAAH